MEKENDIFTPLGRVTLKSMWDRMEKRKGPLNAVQREGTLVDPEGGNERPKSVPEG
jgi:hypothetical protein